MAAPSEASALARSVPLSAVFSRSRSLSAVFSLCLILFLPLLCSHATLEIIRFGAEYCCLQMVPEFDKVVFSGNVKEVLGPVKTQFGHHLIWYVSFLHGLTLFVSFSLTLHLILISRSLPYLALGTAQALTDLLCRAAGFQSAPINSRCLMNHVQSFLAPKN